MHYYRINEIYFVSTQAIVADEHGHTIENENS